MLIKAQLFITLFCITILVSCYVVINITSIFMLHDEGQNRINLRYGDYYINLEHHPEIGVSADELIIYKGNREIFRTEGLIELKQGYELEKVNQIASPILVVNEYSGGAHCCYTTFILELGDTFEILAELQTGYSPAELRTLDDNTGFEIELYDGKYAYQWTSFADSYFPKVIMCLRGKRLSYNIEKMHKLPLSDQQLKEIVSTIKTKHAPKKCEKGDDALLTDNDYFPELLKVVLDLIYSGRAKQAWQVIDETWPCSLQSKQTFISDLKESIKNSQYFEATIPTPGLAPNLSLN